MGLSPLGLKFCPSSLIMRHSALHGPHTTAGMLCAHLCQATGVGCGGDPIKPCTRTGTQIISHFPSEEAVPDAALGPNPDPCPDRLVEAKKGIKKCFPLIPGVLSFLDTPKCASCGSQPYEELDIWLVRSESWAVPGCTHFLITHLGGSVHSLSENSSTHRYKSMCWKARRQMASITPCNQTQDADDLKQLEWEFSYLRVLKRFHSSYAQWRGSSSKDISEAEIFKYS